MLLINKHSFIENSQVFLKSKNKKTNEDDLKNSYLEIVSFLKLNYKNDLIIDNNDFVKFFKIIFKKNNIDLKTTEIYELMAKLFREKNWNVLNSKNVMFCSYFEEVNNRIPTGINLLDNDLLGGIPRKELSVILAGTNVGKTVFCIKMGSNLLRNKSRKFKVLHINLEGSADTYTRYLSELSKIPYHKIIENELTPNESVLISKLKEDFKEQLVVKNYAGSFGATIEKVSDYCKEQYKTFKFDLMIVDYGQLLGSNKDIKEYRLIMSEVFRGLATISKTFNCAVLSPVQATRKAQDKQKLIISGKYKEFTDSKDLVLKSCDISEAFEIARVADVILSINIIDSDLADNKRTLYLERQRNGVKGRIYKTNEFFLI